MKKNGFKESESFLRNLNEAADKIGKKIDEQYEATHNLVSSLDEKSIHEASTLSKNQENKQKVLKRQLRSDKRLRSFTQRPEIQGGCLIFMSPEL